MEKNIWKALNKHSQPLTTMKNILIIKTGALGDVLRTTTILEGLREKYKNAAITWLTSKIAKDLLINNPNIDRIIYNPAKIHKKKWKLIISLEEDKEILKQLSGVKFNKLFGMYHSNGIKYTTDSQAWNDMGLVSRFGKKKADKLKLKNKKSYQKILYNMLGLKWKKQKYSFYPDKKLSRYVKRFKELLPERRKIIGIVVGAGGRWPMKSLSQKKLMKLISEIQKNYYVILLYGPEEKNSVKNLSKRFSRVFVPKLLSVKEFAQVVSLCSVVITPDSLAMHLGIAQNKKVIAYFTVTPAEEIEIYKGRKIKARHKDYGSFTRKNKRNPNITDRISLNKIIKAIE
jgi:heptosyltransferase-2